MLTAEQILALAPDDSSSKAAKGLLNPAKWPTLGSSEAAIWGECQGSGSNPYQVIIDLAGPTFKCTCPSRKFPCKHGLSLYLLRVQKESSFKVSDPTPWALEWLNARQTRAEKAEAKKARVEETAEPEDPEALAKRERQRLKRIGEGAAEAERWLHDLIRQGLADLPSRPASFWQAMAARLVDAQATGLGHWVRQIQSAAASGDRWPERVLSRMGRFQLLLDAVRRLDELPEDLRHDVRTAVGFPMDKDDVLRLGERVSDTWRVLGVSHEESDRLWERRVWLQGATSLRTALVLDFAHGQRRYDQTFVAGTLVAATLSFAPGGFPLRALAVDVGSGTDAMDPVAAEESWDASLNMVASALARNPWLTRWPFRGHATPIRRDGGWFAADGSFRTLKLRVGDDDGWQLRAISGGEPMPIFGEWSGDALRPLTAWTARGGEVLWTEAASA